MVMDVNPHIIRRRVLLPSMALRISGLVGILLAFLDLLLDVFREGNTGFSLPVDAVCACFVSAIAALSVYGASQMRELTSYRWALLAAVLSVFPLWGLMGIRSLLVAVLLSVPAGVWAFIVLRKKEVKEAFSTGREREGVALEAS